jgi:uncharacterized membrane protein HdeD (DUF308 family)
VTQDDTRGPQDEGLTLTQTTHLSGETVRAIDQQVSWAASHWWVVLLAGIAGVIFGAIMVFDFWEGLRILAYFVGFYLLFTGLSDLISSSHYEPRWLAVVSGILAIIGGIIVLVYPGLTLGALTLIMGIAFLVWGAVKAITALMARADGWGWSITGGVLMAIVGVVAMAWPGETLAVISILIGINALIFGFSAIFQSLALRHAARDWEDTKMRARPA